MPDPKLPTAYPFGPGGGVCSCTPFCPVGSTRKVALLPSPSVRASPFRGLVASQANTSPTGANRKEEMNKVKLEGRLTKDPELNTEARRSQGL